MNSLSEKKQYIEYRDFKNKDFLLDIVKKCQDGDTAAMENVYVAYKSPLLSLTYRFTGDTSQAEDLLQDIFIKIFTNIKKLRSPEALNSWLYRIAVNVCMSFARKKGKTKEVSLDEIENTNHSEDDDSLIRQQIEQALKDPHR